MRDGFVLELLHTQEVLPTTSVLETAHELAHVVPVSQLSQRMLELYARRCTWMLGVIRHLTIHEPVAGVTGANWCSMTRFGPFQISIETGLGVHRRSFAHLLGSLSAIIVETVDELVQCLLRLSVIPLEATWYVDT